MMNILRWMFFLAAAFVLPEPVAWGHDKNTRDLETKGQQADDVYDYDQGIKCWRALLKMHPGNCLYWCNLGSDYNNKREYSSAMACLNKAILIDRGATNAFAIRGEVYFNLHKYRQALSDANASLKYYGPDPEAYRLRGDIYVNEGDPDRALAEYNTVVDSFPDYFEGLNNLAWLYATWPDAQNRNGTSAVNLAMQACALSNWRCSYVIDTLAAAKAESGDWEDAVKYQEQAIETAQMAKETKSDLDDYAARLALYKQQKPCREGGN